MVISDLLGGDVLIANAAPATTADTGTGLPNQGTDDIVFDGSDYGLFTSDHDLTLVAGGDIIMLSGVRNEGAGNVNLASGWDGSTGLDPTAFPILDMAAVQAADAFGATGGDVYIGDGSQAYGIAVGSSGGQTTVLGGNLGILGSDTDDAYAQLGFLGAATGDIEVTLTGDLTATAKGGKRGYVQIGHGGYNDDNAHSGTISIDAGGDVTFEAGSNDDAYAHLGHGGLDSVGDSSGDISISATNGLIFAGGSGFGANAQLGHGGSGADGAHSGDILISATGEMRFAAGSGSETYSQLGHGGAFADGNNSGNIAISATGDLAFSAGSALLTYAQFGHGGSYASGDHSGDIAISATGDLSFAGGSGWSAYAQLGHGGYDVDGSHSGNFTIGASGLTFTGGSGLEAFAQLGHGGLDASGSYTGDIWLVLAGDLDLTGGSGADAYAQIGHGDASGGSSGTRTGDISAVVGGMTTFFQPSPATSLISTVPPRRSTATTSTGGYWFGHVTTTVSGVSNADVALVTDGLSVTDGDFSAMLISDLLGGDVLIANTAPATTPDTGTGLPNLGSDDIVFDGSDYGLFTSEHDLTLASGGDIVMLSGVRNEGTGNVSLAGGWDGVNGLDLSTFPILDMAAVQAADAFGGTGGDIYIGDGSQAYGIAVGSSGGQTTGARRKPRHPRLRHRRCLCPTRLPRRGDRRRRRDPDRRPDGDGEGRKARLRADRPWRLQLRHRPLRHHLHQCRRRRDIRSGQQ